MSTDKNQKKLDIPKLTKAAANYSRATGVECLIIFPGDKDMINPCPGEIHESLCYCYSDQIKKYCFTTHCEGAYRSIRKESTHSYFCPMGLLHWAAPIIIQGEVVAALIAGHTFLNQSHTELASLKTIGCNHKELLSSHPGLEQSLLKSPIVDSNHLESLKEMLSLVADSFSDQSAVDYDYTEIKNEFNSRINECDSEWASIPISKILSLIESGDFNHLEKSLNEFLETVDQWQQPEKIVALLTRIILALYDYATKQENPEYLSTICIKTLNQLENESEVFQNNARKQAEEILIPLIQIYSIIPNIKNSDLIYNALQYVDDHYAEKFSLNDIAEHVHFSAPYFSKIFKKEMNITFSNYLTSVRISKSKILLRNPKYSLGSIPEMVGFEEQSYFTKVFRSHTGISPGKYREQFQ